MISRWKMKILTATSLYQLLFLIKKASGNMYTWKNGNYQHVGANIQKSIKIDAETLEIIEAVAGRSFSDKVRNMAAEYVRLKCDELASKK